MGWRHKTVIKEYEMDDTKNHEKYQRTDAYSTDEIGADITISSPTTNSQISEPI